MGVLQNGSFAELVTYCGGGNNDAYILNQIGIRLSRPLIYPLEQRSVYEFLFPTSVPYFYNNERIYYYYNCCHDY